MKSGAFVLIPAAELTATATKEPPADAPLSTKARADALMTEHGLTPRECEIVSLLMQGYLYKQCSIDLGISINTVKFHTRNAYRKLNVEGRSELFSVFLADE
jgi:DNA-binding CsgD family transcriptional regulator